MRSNDWKSVKLGEVCTIGDGAHTKVKRMESGILYLSSKNIQNGKIYLDNVSYICEEDYDRLFSSSKNSVRNLQQGDVLIGIIGTIGNAYVYKSNDNFGISSSIAILRPNLRQVLSSYLYFILSSSYFQRTLAKVKGGSVQGYTNLPLLRSLNIKIPPLSVQQKIASILSVLDDKIELNNRMNKVLEQMAQAIFKQWFVDFEFPNEKGEPYKSNGGKMIESELGMIPMGWKVGKFKDYIDTILGGDWGKENLQGSYNKEVYCLRGADIPEVRAGEKGNLPKRYILEKNYKNKKLESGNLVIEISGGSPTQSTGRITYITEKMLSKYDSDFVCTNFCRAITLKNKKVMEYFFFHWQQLYEKNIFFQYENGTTGIKNFDVNTFIDSFSIIKPSELILGKFNRLIEVLIRKIQVNGNENIILTELRDTLLPSLMSGEIDVSNIEL